MINELKFESFDAEVDQLFRDARAEAEERHDPAVFPDEERVERIVEKARHEAVIKDTTTFFFRSFAAALAELLVALLRTFLSPPEHAAGRPDDANASANASAAEPGIPSRRSRPEPGDRS